MLLFLKKHTVIKLMFLTSLLGLSLLFVSGVNAADNFRFTFRDLRPDEETKHSKIGEEKLLVLEYNGITKKRYVLVEHKPSSAVFGKAVMCGDITYPTVVIRAIQNDTPDNYNSRDKLLIFNDSLEELVDDYESTLVKHKSTDPSGKFRVIVQPKFTLENVEAFVCSSQVNICDTKSGEKLSMQCTFDDGRQANICNGPRDNRLKIGKSSTELDLNHRLTVNNGNGYGYTFNKYSVVNDLQNKGLSGVGKSLSFHNNQGTDYALENHWSARSRDDYDFHTEFNIRRDGNIVESHRCVETNYK